MSTFPPGLSRSWAGAALGMALLTGAPGRAIILPESKDADDNARLEAQSHQEAARHAWVVGLAVRKQGGFGFGTSVYLGESQDGKKAQFLSAAHLFMDDPVRADRKEPISVTLHFGPQMPALARDLPPLAAQWVRLHPDFDYVDCMGLDQWGEPMPARNKVHDLAIVELDIASVLDFRGKMAACGVRPAILYDGVGYAKPLLEAEIVGYGGYGTQSGPAAANRLKIHQGQTLVTYGGWLGEPACFRQWTRISAECMEEMRSGTFGKVHQFVPDFKEILARNADDGSEVRVKSYRRQARTGCGDSGGPLLFNSKDKVMKVAGIASHTRAVKLCVDGQARLFWMDVWMPVKDHLKWILDVRQGLPDSGRVLVFGAAKAAAAAAAGNP